MRSATPMSKVNVKTAVGLLGWIGAATASTAPERARASDWGCQVILCLATPGSPITYRECVPPITRLWQTLAQGGGFPTCAEGGIAITSRRIDDSVSVQAVMPNGALSSYTVNGKARSISISATRSRVLVP